MRFALKLLLFYSLSGVLASYAMTSTVIPERLLVDQPELQKVGDARYSKFGFKLYDAELWATSDRVFELDAQQSYALSLRYLRNITKDKLVSATAKEWQRLAPVSDEQIASWTESIDAIWPDVQTGSVLTCIVFPNNRTEFYYDDQKIGEIADARFGLAFLNIWLDEASQFSKQRQALLGL